MRLHLVLYAMILTACATARPIAGPDGTEHQLISCGPIEHCYEKAREVCGRYKIVNTSTDVTGISGNTSSSIKLLVKCEP